jgi:hypothetical protein
MPNGSELKSRGAQALRAAGFVPLPRWWVKREDLDLIEYMAKQHEAEVNRIRALSKDVPRDLPVEQQIELAWSKHRGL